MSLLRIEGLCMDYPARRGEGCLPVLRDVNLSVERGESVAVVGHSGCGKSTLLAIAGGLISSGWTGTVEVCGARVRAPRPECGMMFQDHRLLPWLRVEDNVSLGLAGSRAKRREEAKRYLRLVGLEDFSRAYPAELSGGMSQRAALARSLARRPSLLLLDEPFSSLDALTRMQLQNELARIRAEEGIAMVLVTHDAGEAVYLCDRVAVLTRRPGRVRVVVPVDLPHRDRESGEFIRIQRTVLNRLTEEEESC